MKIEKINWKKYNIMIDEITKQIKSSNKKYNLIVTFPRGGLPIATSLAHKLNIKNIITINELNNFFFNNLKNYVPLFVDDISDTGKTLYHFSNYDIACLCYKTGTSVIPKYFSTVYLKDEWVEFPWEIN